MRLPVKPRRKETENVIPLINIVFLLLIFFMLAGTLTTPELLQVEPPASDSTGAAEDREAVVLLAADGRIALGDAELTLDGLRGAIAQRLEGNPDLVVKLKADAEVQASSLLDAMEALREAGAAKIHLLTALAR